MSRIALLALICWTGCDPGATVGLNASLGSACQSSQDCANGLSCFLDEPGGDCSVECAVDVNCGAGNRCVNGRCRPGCQSDRECGRNWHCAGVPGACVGASPDLAAAPDLTSPRDLAVTDDLSLPPTGDLAVAPDLAAPPDLAISPPDLATTLDMVTSPSDLATPPDLVVAADLAISRDLAIPQDLSVPLDFAAPPDLAAPLDFSAPRDLAVPPDLTTRNDLSSAPADLALTTPPDLSGPLCGGTQILQKCPDLVAFLTPVVRCWGQAGSCVDQSVGSDSTGCKASQHDCWSSGARRTADQGCGASAFEWDGPGGHCMTGHYIGAGDGIDLSANGVSFTVTARLAGYVFRGAPTPSPVFVHATCNGVDQVIDCPELQALFAEPTACSPGTCQCLASGASCGGNNAACCSGVCDARWNICQ